MLPGPCPLLGTLGTALATRSEVNITNTRTTDTKLPRPTISQTLARVKKQAPPHYVLLPPFTPSNDLPRRWLGQWNKHHKRHLPWLLTESKHHDVPIRVARVGTTPTSTISHTIRRASRTFSSMSCQVTAVDDDGVSGTAPDPAIADDDDDDADAAVEEADSAAADGRCWGRPTQLDSASRKALYAPAGGAHFAPPVAGKEWHSTKMQK